MQLMGIFHKFQQEHYKRFPKKDAGEFDKKMKKYEQLKEKEKGIKSESKVEQKKPEKRK